ncbi:MAG: hypothetical protein WA459_02725, partial [Stellaceae bacterium]
IAIVFSLLDIDFSLRKRAGKYPTRAPQFKKRQTLQRVPGPQPEHSGPAPDRGLLDGAARPKMSRHGRQNGGGDPWECVG